MALCVFLWVILVIFLTLILGVIMNGFSRLKELLDEFISANLMMYQTPNRRTRTTKKRLLLATAVSLTTLSLWLQANVPGMANSMRPSRAIFRGHDGFVRVLLNGRAPAWLPQEYIEKNGALISDQDRGDVVLIGGGHSSYARLEFWHPSQSAPMDPIVQAGPDEEETRYSFPCRLSQGGSTIVGWGVLPAGGACSNRMLSANNQPIDDELLALNNNFVLESSKSNTTEDKSLDILSAGGFSVFRGEELTLIRGHESEENIVVDVLVGTVLIKDFQHRIVEVPSGNRYIYSKESGEVDYEFLDLEQYYTESPALQGYLDPSNWSSEIAIVIEQYRIALNLSVADAQPSLLEQGRMRLREPGSGGGDNY